MKSQPNPQSLGGQHATATFKWRCWDIPERIVATEELRNELGGSLSRLMLIVLRNGSTRLTETRRVQYMLHHTFKMAERYGTTIESVLISQPYPGLYRVRDSVSKRLQLMGNQNLGGGLFAATTPRMILWEIQTFFPDADEPAEPKGVKTEKPNGRQSENIAREEIMESSERGGLAAFSFDRHSVRVVVVDDAPWFVAADVCVALDIQNPTDALKRLDDDERASFNLGRQGEANVINESGLYSLVLGSRKPEAKKFKKWVTSEVLPTLRKTGSYSMPGQERQCVGTGHEAVDRAIEFRAWRVADEARHGMMTLLGVDQDEMAWEMAFRIKAHINQQLLQIVRDRFKQHRPEDVANWIMEWSPAETGLCGEGSKFHLGRSGV